MTDEKTATGGSQVNALVICLFLHIICNVDQLRSKD